MTEDDVTDLARALGRKCLRKRVVVATAESCTGGGVATAITRISGSAKWFDRGFVTYSNEAKTEMLGIPVGVIARHGAVSPQVARAMAEGALGHSAADIAVSVTGVAGPGGGSAAKPVGLVEFSCARRGGSVTQATERFEQLGRSQIRLAAVGRALSLLEQAVGSER